MLNCLENLRDNLSNNLVRLRKLRHWTQHDLAAESGYAISTIRNYEGKKNWPDPDVIEKFASVFEVSPSQLLMGEQTPAIAKVPQDIAEGIASCSPEQLAVVRGVLSGLKNPDQFLSKK